MSQIFRFAEKCLSMLVTVALIAGCSADNSDMNNKPELLVYCGITMVKPITRIARIIEKAQDVRIHINQGGSEDLYQSLKASRVGDLYLPGSAYYRERHLDEGLMTEYVHVGYNQAALLVDKGNPKSVTPDLQQLLRQDLDVVLCSHEVGSIGRESKKLLESANIYNQVLQRAIYLTSDSRNLNGALKQGDADLIINWRATAFFEENRETMDVIDLDPGLAIPKKLLLNLLTFSKHPDVSRRFMEYAASEEGQAIFRQYGFLDNRN